MTGFARAPLHAVPHQPAPPEPSPLALAPAPSPGGGVELYAAAENEILEWMQEAEEEAEAIIERAISVARHDAARIRSDAMEYAAATLARAEREAAEMRQAAAEAVTRLLREARSEAERIRALATSEARLIVEDGRRGLVRPAPSAPRAPAPQPIERVPGPVERMSRPVPAPAGRPPAERMARPPAERMAPPPALDPAPYLDGADDVTPSRRPWWLRQFGNGPAA